MLLQLPLICNPLLGPICQRHRTDVSFVPRAEGSGRAVDGDYAYNSGIDKERRKATIEHVYRESDGVAKTSSSSAPWSFGWQMNERNLVWNNDLKLRLLKVRLIYDVPISRYGAEDADHHSQPLCGSAGEHRRESRSSA